MTTETPLKKPLHRHMQFAVSACIGVVALAIALVLRAPIAYSISQCVLRRLHRHRRRPDAAAHRPLSEQECLRHRPAGAGHLCRDADCRRRRHRLVVPVDQSRGSPHPVELTFALVSIPLGWFTIHAMTALHYAHVYWLNDEETDPGSKAKQKKPVGGLVFAGKERPDGWDFLYFSTTVGMTSQTSDTTVSTTHMRRIVLLHSIVSFFFNTVIVAAAVNLAVSLGSQ